MNKKQQFSVYLRQIMDENNITQKKMAKKLGISQPAISRVMKGENSFKPSRLKKLKSLFPSTQFENLQNLYNAFRYEQLELQENADNAADEQLEDYQAKQEHWGADVGHLLREIDGLEKDIEKDEEEKKKYLEVNDLTKADYCNQHIEYCKERIAELQDEVNKRAEEAKAAWEKEERTAPSLPRKISQAFNPYGSSNDSPPGSTNKTSATTRVNPKCIIAPDDHLTLDLLETWKTLDRPNKLKALALLEDLKNKHKGKSSLGEPQANQPSQRPA